MSLSRSQVVFRALRHRNYRLFFSGQLISLIGTWMQTVAQSWLVYRLTGSTVALGSVGFCSQIAVFVLAPLGGVTADRYPRQRIILATQSAAMILAFSLAALTLSGLVRPTHVYLLATLLGLVNAFDIPARQSFVVEMVGKQDLLNAIALNSSMFNGARVVGPAVAGILVGLVGEGWCFFLNGASYLAVIAGLLAIRVPPRDSNGHSTSRTQEMVEGFRFVLAALPIRALLSLLGLVSLMGIPYTVLMPVFAEDILHSGARGLGMLTGAAGLGAVMGALLLAQREGTGGLAGWIPKASAGFGLAIVSFAGSRSFWLSLALLVPVGFCVMVQMASTNTLIQSMVPDAMRGRVMAVYSMMFMGMSPMGSLLAGAMASRVGAPETVALGGLACLVGALIFQRRAVSGHLFD